MPNKKPKPGIKFSKRTVKKMGAEGPKRSIKTFSGKKPPRRTPGLGKAIKNTQRGRKPWN